MTIDPKNYQVVKNGKVRLVSELTRDELIQELCMSMDYIEEFENLQAKMNERVESLSSAWRNGREIPIEEDNSYELPHPR